jgi:hypothetical protein
MGVFFQRNPFKIGIRGGDSYGEEVGTLMEKRWGLFWRRGGDSSGEEVGTLMDKWGETTRVGDSCG